MNMIKCEKSKTNYWSWYSHWLFVDDVNRPIPKKTLACSLPKEPTVQQLQAVEEMCGNALSIQHPGWEGLGEYLSPGHPMPNQIQPRDPVEQQGRTVCQLLYTIIISQIDFRRSNEIQSTHHIGPSILTCDILTAIEYNGCHRAQDR